MNDANAHYVLILLGIVGLIWWGIGSFLHMTFLVNDLTALISLIILVAGLCLAFSGNSQPTRRWR